MLPDVKYLILDFETRNVEDLAEVGLDNYSRTCEPVLLSWKLTGGVWNLWRIYKEPMPQQLCEALLDPTVIKVAWNAQFERVIFKNAPLFDNQFNIPINQWRDPMILARSLSMPGALEKVCAILKMGEDEAKLEGNWIELFCQPRRKKKKDPPGMGVYNDWNSHPQEWARFEEYCLRDGKVEENIWFKFLPLSFPEEQWEDYWMDQEINEFGMPVNVDRALKAYNMAVRYKAEAMEEMMALTGLDNPNSPKHQLLPWLQARGYKWGSLNKQFTEPVLKDYEANGGSELSMIAYQVLSLRKKSSSSSFTKLARLVKEVGPDGRLRYQFSYMGAARTGRWSSPGINVQNMLRPIKVVKKNPDRAMQLVDAQDYETIMKENDGTVLPFVCSCIRLMFEVQ